MLNAWDFITYILRYNLDGTALFRGGQSVKNLNRETKKHKLNASYFQRWAKNAAVLQEPCEY